MPSRYRFSDYRSDWPQAFAREAARFSALLGECLVEVHHVGSTAVPGLAAKEVIDLLPCVRDIGQADALTGRIVAAGWQAWGEFGLPGRRYFSRDEDGFRVCNAHVYAVGDPDVERHLAFAAWLRAHPQARDQYARLKHAAFAAHPGDLGAYNDAKHEWVRRAEREAVAWWHADGRAEPAQGPSSTPRRDLGRKPRRP